MKFQSSNHSILTKLAFLLTVVLFTVLVIITMLTRQTQYIILGIAVFVLPLYFTKRDSIIFQITSTLVFLLAVAFFATQFGLILPGIQAFHLVVFFGVLLAPVLITKPRLTLYFYLMIILLFSGTSYGMGLSTQAAFFNIYGKGTGVLHYSFLNMLLFCMFLSIVVHDYILKNRNDTHIECNLYKYFWLFNAVYFIYILVGMGHGVSFFTSTFFLAGVVNITNMTLFVFLLIKLFRSEKDVEMFMKIYLGCMAVKGVYGVFRFIFMNGDPANHYANVTHMKAVVITFFDWGEGFVACIAVFFSLWLLMKGSQMLSKKEKLFYRLVISVGTFNMLFSYRRTVWSGMALVIIWLLYHMTAKQRMVALILIMVIGSTVFVTLVENRFGQAGDRTFIQNVAPDMFSESTGEVTVKEGRFYELYSVWQIVKKNLLFGVGPWGNLELSTHSSIMFILLKMGLVGLIIYLAIFVTYLKFWLKARKEQWISTRLRAFGEAGFAGFIFCIPSIFFAPMIFEYRTMTLMGLSLALPYVAYYFNKDCSIDCKSDG